MIAAIEAMWAAIALLGVLVLFNLALTLALVRRVNAPERRAMESMVGLKPGQVVPAFSVETLDGRKFTQASFSGRRTVLLFVAPDCRPCIEAMPEFLRLASMAESTEPNLVLVSSGDLNTIRTMVGDVKGTTVLVAPKESSDIFDRFEVPGTPHFVLIENGEIVLTGMPNPMHRGWRSLVTTWKGEPRMPAGAAAARETA